MEERITLAHGAGGEASRELTEKVFLPAFENGPLNDSAIAAGADRWAITTDSFVVRPLFFPGGDIGRLAVSGTVNDLAMSGAVPKYLTAGMILEDGLEIEVLRRIVQSMAETAREAGVRIVTGDTKVVERGRGDGIYINTAGVGLFEAGRIPSQIPRAGDVIIVSGPLASHGMAVLCAREGLDFAPPILSDAAPLNGLAAAAAAAGEIHAMRDPTRGGAAAALCEWATDGTAIEVDEAAVPVLPGVRAACDMLGMDPMHIANEGVMLLSVPERDSESVLKALRSHGSGRDAAVLGRVREGGGEVWMKTSIGTKRRIFMPRGELLPRIC